MILSSSSFVEDAVYFLGLESETGSKYGGRCRGCRNGHCSARSRASSLEDLSEEGDGFSSNEKSN